MTAPILVASSASEPPARHLTSDLDLSPEALTRVLDLAAQMKRTPARFSQTLAGRYLSLAVRKAVAAHAHDVRAGHQATRRRRGRCNGARSASASR